MKKGIYFSTLFYMFYFVINSNIGSNAMKYSLFVAAIFVMFFLVACGEPKPGSNPPSQSILDDRDQSMLDDNANEEPSQDY